MTSVFHRFPLALVAALTLPLGAAAQTATAPLPGVTVFATGGTIAGSAASSTNTTSYKAGTIGVDALVAAVPALAQVATVKTEQIANVPSSDIGQAVLLRMAQAINQTLAGPSQGVVVTHGTDTLEETAFFLDLTTSRSGKPVVVVGAMRPASALSADGPMNLLQAVSLAAHPAAVGRGALVVLNDRIGSAYYTTKTHSTAVDTFRATEQGYLGVFLGTEPRFYYSAATPPGKWLFDVQGLQALPKVAIVYMHEDQDAAQIDDALARGAKGIVIAANGAGSLPMAVKQRVQQLTERGFPVVRATRTGSGFAVKEDSGGIAAGSLNAQKSRILLMLALSQGADLAQVRALFHKG